MNDFKLSPTFDDTDSEKKYWTDGEHVFFRYDRIKNADLLSFEQFHGSWARDRKNCYSLLFKLKNADRESFRVLNLTYAKDQKNVWTLGGRIIDADADTFVVCDQGRRSLGITKTIRDGKELFNELWVPYGFGKDKNNVYYYDFQVSLKC